MCTGCTYSLEHKQFPPKKNNDGSKITFLLNPFEMVFFLGHVLFFKGGNLKIIRFEKGKSSEPNLRFVGRSNIGLLVYSSKCCGLCMEDILQQLKR